jgi:hypothetical protein
LDEDDEESELGLLIGAIIAAVVLAALFAVIMYMESGRRKAEIEADAQKNKPEAGFQPTVTQVDEPPNNEAAESLDQPMPEGGEPGEPQDQEDWAEGDEDWAEGEGEEAQE